jgi:hypothetical protein
MSHSAKVPPLAHPHHLKSVWAIAAAAVLVLASPARRVDGQQTASARGAINVGSTIYHPRPDDPAFVNAPEPLPSLANAQVSIGQPSVSAGLTINALFDSSIDNDSNAASIKSTINSAIAEYQAQFSDPITVTILFREMSSGLGQSNWYYYTGYSYSTVIAALRADATSTDDATAISLLPQATTNPVTGTTSTSVKPAHLRAIGINQTPPSDCVATGLAQACDGIVSLNTHLTTPGSSGSTLSYSLKAVIQHEIDEVLGLGSFVPSAGPMIEDLFRYNQSGSRYYNTADSRTTGVFAYFSLDSTTRLAEFDNQNDGGDTGDWQSTPRRAGVAAQVQDAFATAGAFPALGVEIRALDAVGYDTVPAPSITSQPASPTISYNSAASLSVTASGGSLSYQWYQGASASTANPVSGATSSSYTTPALISDKKYWVRVSNSTGTADSNTAVVTVNFTDPTLSAESTLIKKQHWDEVAARINAEETRAGRSNTSFRTLTAGSSLVLRQDYLDRRSALETLFSLAGLTPVWHSNPSPGSAITTTELNDLRTNLHALETR